MLLKCVILFKTNRLYAVYWKWLSGGGPLKNKLRLQTKEELKHSTFVLSISLLLYKLKKVLTWLQLILSWLYSYLQLKRCFLVDYILIIVRFYFYCVFFKFNQMKHYLLILHFTFLFSLSFFVSAAGHYFRIWTGHYFSIWTIQVPALLF